MNKGSGNQDTGTEMLTEEKHLRRDLHPLDLLCNDWEATSSDRRSEHNDCIDVNLMRVLAFGFSLTHCSHV